MLDRRATLADIPGADLDRVGGRGFDWALLKKALAD
jgi:hypothetical protein